MGNILQDPRPLAIDSPLGKDVLLLNSIEGEEELSKPFLYKLELSSKFGGLGAEKIVGHPVSIRVDAGRESTRYFHGIIKSFSQGLRNDDLTTYYAEMVPWLALLGYRKNCRIMSAPESREQGKTTPEIVQSVFSEVASSSGIPCDFEMKLNDTYAPHEFCVQYRETDLNFVSRLLEEEGIFYFFKHEQNKHTLVLADNDGAYYNVPDSDTELPEAGNIHNGLNQVRTWQRSYDFHPGKYTQTDYNFESTDIPMGQEQSRVNFKGMSAFEMYDFHGRHPDEDRASFLATRRIEEFSSTHTMAKGSSKCGTFTPGAKFKFSYHRNQNEIGQSYALTKVRLRAQLYNYVVGQDGEFDFSNEFECIPSTTVYRPRRVTKKPIVEGVQTAVVIGPNDETEPEGKGKDKEIYVDNHARVKVRFHWMRKGDPLGEQKSCWVRVSQAWAGGDFGGMNIPRIGHEVMVSFLEGDPDRPIISGRVYNGSLSANSSNAGRKGNTAPTGIPDAAMMTSFKSSSVGGAGSNEITMNDEGGSEGLFFKAQKDEIHNVGNDRTDTVGNDETMSVANNRTRDVGVDEKVTIGNNQTLDVLVNKSSTVGVNHTEKIGTNQSVTVGTNQSNKVGSNQTNSVGLMKNEMVGLMSNEMVGLVKTLNAAAAISVNAGFAMTTVVGLKSYEKVGSTKKIDVGSKLELVCGASKLTMTSGGKVTIEGTEFLFKASGNVAVKGAIIDLN